MQSTAAVPAHHVALYRELADDARRVEDLGFDSLWLAEHRFWYDGWCPAPAVAAGLVAATTQLRIGTAMVLLPQHDAGRIADLAATVDQLSGGRFELGVGLGHRDAEFDGLGLQRRDRARRMDAALALLAERWRPDAPVWVGGMAPAALARARVHGAGVLLPMTLYDHELDTTLAALGPEPPRLAILKDVWVDHDGGAAREFFLDAIRRHYREEAGSWWLLQGQPGHERPDLLEAQLDRMAATAIAGDPDEVTESLLALAARGFELIIVRLAYDVTRGARLRDALDLFAQKVLPALRAAA